MVRALKELGWFFINAAQLLWFAFFCSFCFFLGLLLFCITWNADTALGLGRTLMGPINFRLGFSTLHVEGEQHIPRDRPFIMMMNHQSMADIMVSWMISPVALRFIAKKMLAYVPVVGWTMVLFQMVWIDRGNARSAIRSLKRAANIIKQGHALCAWPEGTRSTDGRIGPFKKGVFILAMKAGVPIVPVAIEGAHIMVPRKGWKPRPVAVRVRVGAPISTAGLYSADRDALIQRVRNEIITMHRSIGGKGGEASDVSSAPSDEGTSAAVMA